MNSTNSKVVCRHWKPTWKGIESNKWHSRNLSKWPLPRMTTFFLSNSNRSTQDSSWIVHLTILWEKLTSFLWRGTIQCPWLCWCSHYDIHSLKTRDLVTKQQTNPNFPMLNCESPKKLEKNITRHGHKSMYGSSCLDFKLSPKYVCKIIWEMVQSSRVHFCKPSWGIIILNHQGFMCQVVSSGYHRRSAG